MPKIFILEEVDLDVEISDSSNGLNLDLVHDNVTSSDGAYTDITKGGKASISLHVILGSPKPKTICLCGMINRKQRMILVYS